MPVRELSDADVAALTRWPAEVLRSDLGAFFSLGVEDHRWLRAFRGTAHRLGLAVSLCALRYLGFIPEDLAEVPPEVVATLAAQVGGGADQLARYGRNVDGRLRRLHEAETIRHAGWHPCRPGDWKRLGDWLVTRAVEHDDSELLFRQLLEHLRAERIVRPGLDRLLRTVGSARMAAYSEINRRWARILTPSFRETLDALVRTDPERGMAPLVWLFNGAVSNSPPAIKAEVAKLAFLTSLGADRLDLSAVPPGRVRELAALAKASTPKALHDLAPERRYPVLLAALAHLHPSVVDELVQMFDQALAGTDDRAKAVLAERESSYVQANLARLDLLEEILAMALDDTRTDAAVGAAVRALGHGRLEAAVRTPQEHLPPDGGHLALMDARYAHIRSFAPQVLGALEFRASTSPSETLEATRLLQRLNAQGRRHVPADAPTGFVPSRWTAYLKAARAACDDNAYRHYWELCSLFALQKGLDSGEIWVRGSRRYANPASYLIPTEAWPERREEVLGLLGAPGSFAEALATIDADLTRYLDDLEALVGDGTGAIRLVRNGELVLSPLAAEVLEPEVAAEKKAVMDLLPMVPIIEILVLVDAETGFTSHLPPAGDARPRASGLEHRRNLYAAILSEACNFGPTRTAELTGVPVDTIDWYTRWYLKDPVTRKAANAAIVNVHHRQPLARLQGGGSLSSSDGVRLPTRGKSLTARALSRYFVDEGVTSYTHVSDELSVFGTQIIVTTRYRPAIYAAR